MKLETGLRAAAALALAGLLGLVAPVTAQQGEAMRRVDLELVLAVDISQSMDQDEHELQRNGYVDAFRHKDVVNALMSGPEGRIAVVYEDEVVAELGALSPVVMHAVGQGLKHALGLT